MKFMSQKRHRRPEPTLDHFYRFSSTPDDANSIEPLASSSIDLRRENFFLGIIRCSHALELNILWGRIREFPVRVSWNPSSSFEFREGGLDPYGVELSDRLDGG